MLPFPCRFNNAINSSNIFHYALCGAAITARNRDCLSYHGHILHLPSALPQSSWDVSGMCFKNSMHDALENWHWGEWSELAPTTFASHTHFCFHKLSLITLMMSSHKIGAENDNWIGGGGGVSLSLLLLC